MRRKAKQKQWLKMLRESPAELGLTVTAQIQVLREMSGDAVTVDAAAKERAITALIADKWLRRKIVSGGYELSRRRIQQALMASHRAVITHTADLRGALEEAAQVQAQVIEHAHHLRSQVKQIRAPYDAEVSRLQAEIASQRQMASEACEHVQVELEMLPRRMRLRRWAAHAQMIEDLRAGGLASIRTEADDFYCTDRWNGSLSTPESDPGYGASVSVLLHGNRRRPLRRAHVHMPTIKITETVEAKSAEAALTAVLDRASGSLARCQPPISYTKIR